MTARSAIPLLPTKLEAPVPRDLVPRAGLAARLDEADARLTLIRAPAGWGKTMLLAEWHASRRPAAWLSLDRADDDPARFWAHVIAALRRVEPAVGDRSLALLPAPGVDLVGEVLPALVDELAAAPAGLVLTLDDYHVIEEPAVHDGVALLLERLPGGVRVVVASRSEPPLPLGRMRAGGDLVELGPAELRFSRDETEALLNGVHGLGLDRADVERLNDRTEGWAAGLYLAVLSLSARDDRHAFVEAFAGDDRYVVDYLGAEVLAEQAAEIRTFMLRTSILDRFNAPLADAVVGTGDAGELLTRIERSNHFLVPLDTRREWYRYHHLFGDLLRRELANAEAALVPELHARAAVWLDEAGLPSEAIHHAIEGGDLARTAELIALHWLPFTSGGSNAVAAGWLDALPEEAVLADARLCLVRGWTAFATGRLTDVLRWAALAERAPLPGPLRDGTTSVAAGVALMRASYWLLAGDINEASRWARETMRLEESPHWRAVATNCLATCRYWLGDEDEAVALHGQAIRLGGEEMPLIVVVALGRLGAMAAFGEDWPRAQRLVDEALRVIEDQGVEEYWMTCAARIAHGAVLAHEGRLGDAEVEVERALALASRGAGPLDVVLGLTQLAVVRAARGDAERAQALVAVARARVDALPGMLVPRPLDEVERRLADDRPAAANGGEELSAREQAVLRLLATELTQRQIGDELEMSVNTVKTHARSIFRKLGVSNRREAVARSREQGVL
jgi:ATP/maltotriose-dependent transcriptional regulator MalT